MRRRDKSKETGKNINNCHQKRVGQIIPPKMITAQIGGLNHSLGIFNIRINVQIKISRFFSNRERENELTAMIMLRAAISILRQARAAGLVSSPQPIFNL